MRNNDAGLSCEPAIHPEGNAIHGLVEGTISSEMERSVRRVSFAASTPSGKTRISPDEMTLRRFPSGQNGFSPDKTTSRSISSDKNHDILDGRPMRIVHQNHFGSQCATEACRMAPPCQGGAKKVSLWQATLNRVRSTPSSLPK